LREQRPGPLETELFINDAFCPLFPGLFNLGGEFCSKCGGFTHSQTVDHNFLRQRYPKPVTHVQHLPEGEGVK
jgi:hypothetical protein